MGLIATNLPTPPFNIPKLFLGVMTPEFQFGAIENCFQGGRCSHGDSFLNDGVVSFFGSIGEPLRLTFSDGDLGFLGFGASFHGQGVVPEPGTLFLLGLGVLVLACRRTAR